MINTSTWDSQSRTRAPTVWFRPGPSRSVALSDTQFASSSVDDIQLLERLHGDFISGCSLWFARAGHEARIHDRGCPDAGSGRGSQHGDFQHRECRAAAFSAVPRSRSFGTNLL